MRKIYIEFEAHALSRRNHCIDMTVALAGRKKFHHCEVIVIRNMTDLVGVFEIKGRLNRGFDEE